MKCERTAPADITSSSRLAMARGATAGYRLRHPTRADDVTSMHHTRYFRTYVMASTANQIGCRILPVAVEAKGGLAMLAEN